MFLKFVYWAWRSGVVSGCCEGERGSTYLAVFLLRLVGRPPYCLLFVFDHLMYRSRGGVLSTSRSIGKSKLEKFNHRFVIL